MSGIIMPEKNCELRAEMYSLSLNALNSSSVRSSPLNRLTTLCPANVSSM